MFSRWSIDPADENASRLAGVGVFLAEDYGRVHVKELVVGAAAERSRRVERGDVVISVDGVDVSSLTTTGLRSLIVGEMGTFVRIGFRRSNRFDFEVDLMRGTPEFIAMATAPSQALTKENLARLDPQIGRSKGGEFGGGGRWSVASNDSENMQDQAGVGLFLQQDSDHPKIYVVKIVPNTAAHASGCIKIGDILVSIDDVPLLETERVSDIRRKVVGKMGSVVRLGFITAGSSYAVDLMRGTAEYFQKFGPASFSNYPQSTTSSFSNYPQSATPSREMPLLSSSSQLPKVTTISTPSQVLSSNAPAAAAATAIPPSTAVPVASQGLLTPSNLVSRPKELSVSQSYANGNRVEGTNMMRWSLQSLPDDANEHEIAGVGVYMKEDPVSDTVYLQHLVPGASAARSGRVKVGDVIIRVDGVDVRHEDISALRRRIVGPPGTYVTLGFKRDAAQEIEVSLMRGTPEYISAVRGPDPNAQVQPVEDASKRIRQWQLENAVATEPVVPSLRSSQTLPSAPIPQPLVSQPANNTKSEDVQRLERLLFNSEERRRELEAQLYEAKKKEPQPASQQQVGTSALRGDSHCELHDGQGFSIRVGAGSITQQDLAKLFPRHLTDEIFDAENRRFVSATRSGGFLLEAGHSYLVRPNPVINHSNPNELFDSLRPQWKRVLHEVFIYDNAREVSDAAAAVRLAENGLQR